MPQKGHPNLMTPQELNATLTPEERRASASRAGKASAEARRRKRDLKYYVQKLATCQISDEEVKTKKSLEALGIEAEDMTREAVVAAGLYKEATKGDAKAIKLWSELNQNIVDDDKAYELPARVIGRAFVDINRQIIPNKQYVFKGGRGGLKSSFVSLKVVELIKNNPQMHACIIRKVAGTLKDSVYAQVKWAINELGLTDEFECKINPLEIRYLKTGQKIFFRGCDDPIKLKSIKPEFGYIGIQWIEERDQLSGAAEERSVTQSVLRGGDIAYQFSSYNPPKSKSNWVNMELREPNINRVVHHSTYLDSPIEWLGQKFVDDAEHLKEVNPEAYEHEYMGVANGEGGAVFEFLDIREISDEEIARMDTIYQGADWGWYPDPFAFVRLYYDTTRDTIYFIDEHCVNKSPNSETGQWIIDHEYDDYPVTCDSAENKSVNDFKDMGIPARSAIKGAGSVEYGMKFLQGRKIVIDPKRTPTVYKEFSQYEYERDKEGNVISGYPDKDNHTIDATRYALEQFYNRRGTSA